MVQLAEYRRKRRFNKTPEPAGRLAHTTKTVRSTRPRTGGLYLIQKHAARRLHYDFRLELGGVLKSWAIPKGPSLDPAEKRLAVHVEDHPIEYGEFEGTIPEGEYGGGTVMLWDKGTWMPLDDPHAGYKKGHLSFELKGKRLKGRWSLVRIRRRDDDDRENWLLIKARDEHASTTVDLLAAEKSVASGRTMEAIARDDDSPVWTNDHSPTRTKNARSPAASSTRSKVSGPARATRSRRTSPKKSARIDPSSLVGAEAAPMPARFFPQLATLVSKVPDGGEWLHEIKFDGYRLLCFLKDGTARLLTRAGNDWTADFPGIAQAAEELAVSETILDGEAAVVRADGTTDFQALQNAVKDRRLSRLPIKYFVFDLPYCQGFDLTRTPLIERKKLLKEIILASQGPGKVFVYSEHVAGSGAKVFQVACTHAMEGVVSKRADAPYEQRRTRTWLKTKCVFEQEFVIGGYTEPSNTREAFGALLLGFYEGPNLIFCGRVGTGFTVASLRFLHRQLAPLETDKPPFAHPPRGSDARRVHWVRPELVAEVEYNEWTREGILRHPSFKGLRMDKDPREVLRETPTQPALRAAGRPKDAKVGGKGPRKKSKAVLSRRAVPRTTAQSAPPMRRLASSAKARNQARVAGVTLSNSDRVLYPQQGITKRELAEFYESIADWVLPHVVNRPLSLVRCPSGRHTDCFYQKHLTEQMPEGIGGVAIREKEKTRTYIYIQELKGLIGLVQLGVLEIHPWGCRVEDVEKPDRLVFDLDPGPGVEWPRVLEAARRLREMLRAVSLESFVKTSGGKGLHVVAPIGGIEWDDLKSFARGIVSALEHERPDRYVITMTKAHRRGKIFLDYLRNGRGATCVAAYSTRAREGATVSTPVAWEELSARLRPDMYNVRNLIRRLGAKRDPWEGFFTIRQSISPAAISAVQSLKARASPRKSKRPARG